jgi:Sulfotransferase family
VAAQPVNGAPIAATGTEERSSETATSGAVDPVIRISRVDLAAPKAEVAAVEIVHPVAGRSAPTYAFELSGWVASAAEPFVALKVGHGEAVLWRLPLSDENAGLVPQGAPDNARGFATAFSSLALPPQFELSVTAAREDGQDVPIATVTGERRELRLPPATGMRPLAVNTFGRTGSRVFLQLLSANANVVAYMAPKYEPKAASYWVAVLRSLSEPKSYLSQIHSPLSGREWWLGRETPTLWRIPDPSMQEWLGRENIEDLARIVRQRIDAFYERAAERSGRHSAAYFAEKFTAGGLVSLVWELYPNAKEVMLVRDFRDMLASIAAFNEKKQRQMFGRARFDSDRDFVFKLSGYANGLVADWKRRSDRVHVVRYEDLVLRPDETARALLDYLELEADPAVVAAMSQAASHTREDMTEHRTAPSSRASVGRWKTDLDDELKEACEVAFRPALAAFGYEA